MVAAILVAVLICGLFFIFVRIWVIETKRERDEAWKEIEELREHGEIITAIMNNPTLEYYRDHYTDPIGEHKGGKMTMHALGLKGWTFQECQQYGITVTHEEGSYKYTVDIIEYMAEAWAENVSQYRKNNERIYVAGADPFDCKCDSNTGIKWDMTAKNYKCRECHGIVKDIEENLS